MDAEERTTLDRLVEELDDGPGRAPILWNLALERAKEFRSLGRPQIAGYRLLGVIETLAAITGEPPRNVALDLSVFGDLRAIAIDL